jgi:hypothetical protein
MLHIISNSPHILKIWCTLSICPYHLPAITPRGPEKKVIYDHLSIYDHFYSAVNDCPESAF